MDIVALFGTDERLKLLQRVYFSDGVRVTELAESTGLSKGFVSLQLGVLVKEGVLRRKGMTFFPKEDPAIRILLLRSVMTDEFLKKHKAAGGAFAKVDGTQPYDAWTTDEIAASDIQRKIPGCKVLLGEIKRVDSVMFGGGR